MRVLLMLSLLAIAWGGVVRAEKVPMSAEENAEVATDIVVGRVNAIYVREQDEGDWRVAYLVAEVAIEKVEKGKSLEPKGLVYARYWHRGWIGKGQVPPSTNGHRGLPGEKDKVRVYLARNAYDGFTFDNKDGGYNVIGADGWEVLEKAPDVEAPAAAKAARRSSAR